MASMGNKFTKQETNTLYFVVGIAAAIFWTVKWLPGLERAQERIDFAAVAAGWLLTWGATLVIGTLAVRFLINKWFLSHRKDSDNQG